MRDVRNIAAEDASWDMKRPCADCPFRRSTPWHEGVACSTIDYFHSIEAHTFSHSCHKTDSRADSVEGKRYEGPVQHCIGSLFMLVKSGHGLDCQIPLLEASRDGKLDLGWLEAAGNADTECFTLDEFLAFNGAGLGRHIDEQERRARNRRRGRKAV